MSNMITEDEIQLLLQCGAGRRVTIDNRTPFNVDDLSHCWYVMHGYLTIFVVEHENLDPVTERCPDIRVDADTIIMPFGEHNFNGRNCKLTAAGDAEIVELDMDKFINKFASEPHRIAEFIDRWLEVLAAGIVRKLCPHNALVLPNSGKFTIPAGNYFYSRKPGILWCRMIYGECVFPEEPCTCLIRSDMLIPMRCHAWLETITEVEIETMTTLDVIRLDDWRQRLISWQKIVLNIFKLERIAAIHAEKNRLAASEQREDALDIEAYCELASVLNRRRLPHANDHSPVEYAWNLVTEYLHIPASAAIFADDQDPEKALLNHAHDCGIKIRKVTLSPNWWNKDCGPIIAWSDQATKIPMVLLPEKTSGYSIVNAANQQRVPANRQTVAGLRPYGHVIYRPFPSHPLRLNDVLTFAALGNFGNVSLALLMAVAAAVTGLLIPICTGVIFNTVIPEARYGQLLALGMIILAGAVAGSLFQLTLSISMIRLEKRTNFHLQAALVDRLLALPIPFFHRFNSGDLTWRCLGITNFQSIISDSATTMIIGSVFSIFYLVALFIYSAALAEIAILFSCALLLALAVIAYMNVRLSSQECNLQGAMAANMIETLGGIEKIRLCRAENRFFNYYASQLQKFADVHLRSRVCSSVQALINAVFPIGTTMVFFYWIGKNHSNMPLGDFIAFIAMYSAFMAAVTPMTISLISLVNIVPLYKRIQPLLQATPEAVGFNRDPGRLTGELKVCNLSFGYTAAGQTALKNINLNIRPGEFIALVGRSGAGKSTLLKLLLGFNRPDSGEIFYNGMSLESLDIRKVRRQLGVVLQNGQLFDGSIFDNISCGRTSSVDDAWVAAITAGCEREIKEMPLQMDTILTAGGGLLPGGLKQRLLIARCLLLHPRMIFFDEATSALDNQSQAIIARRLEHLKISRIVVAHRLSTIVNADRIYVMDQGTIVDSGTYQELVRRNEFFAGLVGRQIP